MEGASRNCPFTSARAMFTTGAMILTLIFGWLPAGAQEQQDPANQPTAVIHQPGTAVGQPAATGEQPGMTTRQPADTTPQQAPEVAEATGPEIREIPRSLNLKRGLIITARTSQFLSSNRNKAGDSFSAELTQPIVVDGWVVARRGQTVMGRVAMVHRAGRIKGTSKLVVEINKLILVDGQQVAIHSQLLRASGDTSKGRDARAVGTTTGMGAAIGGVANGGTGAGVGAAIGAGAGLAGVLFTRGRPTVIPAESTLTFELSTPIAVSTGHSGPAFRPVVPQDYAQRDGRELERRGERIARRPYGPPPFYSPWFGPWGYPAPFYFGFTYFGGHAHHRGFRH